MKKLIFIMMLVLTAGLFTSCQKGENFFHGTWSGQSTQNYYDDGEYYSVTEALTITFDKKNNTASGLFEYRDSDGDRSSYSDFGTYTLINDNTIHIDGQDFLYDCTLYRNGDNLLYNEDGMSITLTKNK